MHIADSLIREKTPESQEVTDALGNSGTKFFNSEITVAVTGLLSSGGSETTEKPVGTMFISILFKNLIILHREVFVGTAEEIILQTVDKVGELLLNKFK